MSDTTTEAAPKRDQILAGAARVFAADGYEGASMSRIAAAAGVSKGTLYNYFPGKADLFAAWVSLQCEQTLAQTFGALEHRTDPAEALDAIGHRIVAMLMSDAGLVIYRVVVSEAWKFPELARAFWDAGPARGLAAMAAFLREAAASGALHVPDPDFAAEQFFALCHTKLVLRRKLALLDAPDEAAVRQVVRGAVHMFLQTHLPRPST